MFSYGSLYTRSARIYESKGTYVRTDDYPEKLFEKLSSYYTKASDKKAFLTKTLDELLKYNGISGENFDTIVKNITKN